MSTTNTGGVLASLSDELSNAVQKASQAVVTVDARRQLAASGIVWPAGATAPAPAELAPIDSVKIGHVALAVGRPGDGATMATFGIVSATGGSWRTARGGTVDGYVRADVTLYPGFSGGPLVDATGRVIGLNSWHIANGQELAIPAAAVSATVQILLTQGSIKRAYLGVTSQPAALPDSLRQKLGVTQATGLVIVGVETGSPAEKSGLVLGDVLVTFGVVPDAAATGFGYLELGEALLDALALLLILRQRSLTRREGTFSPGDLGSILVEAWEGDSRCSGNPRQRLFELELTVANGLHALCELVLHRLQLKGCRLLRVPQPLALVLDGGRTADATEQP